MFNLGDRFLLGFEDQGEGDADYQSEGSEGKPARLPLTDEESVLPMAEAVDNLTSSQCTDGGTNTISHHHKQSLCRSLDAVLALLVDEDTTRDIEEIEGHTIDDA